MAVRTTNTPAGVKDGRCREGLPGARVCVATRRLSTSAPTRRPQRHSQSALVLPRQRRPRRWTFGPDATRTGSHPQAHAGGTTVTIALAWPLAGRRDQRHAGPPRGHHDELADCGRPPPLANGTVLRTVNKPSFAVGINRQGRRGERQFAPGEFYDGGSICLPRLADECFRSFLAETALTVGRCHAQTSPAWLRVCSATCPPHLPPAPHTVKPPQRTNATVKGRTRPRPRRPTSPSTSADRPPRASARRQHRSAGPTLSAPVARPPRHPRVDTTTSPRGVICFRATWQATQIQERYTDQRATSATTRQLGTAGSTDRHRDATARARTTGTIPSNLYEPNDAPGITRSSGTAKVNGNGATPSGFHHRRLGTTAGSRTTAVMQTTPHANGCNAANEMVVVSPRTRP